jgi:hypothetical protein
MSNTILQPVKLESNVNNTQAKVASTPTTHSTDEKIFSKSNSSKSLPINQSPSLNTPKAPNSVVSSPIDPNLVKNLASAMEEIDLTYFESGKSESKINGLENKSRKGKAENTTEVIASDKNKKNKYLDQLLKDIYSNDPDKTSNKSSENTSTKREEDILSDKKCKFS